MMTDKLYQRRHHDDNIIDHVEIRLVPRYKTSYLSGDEWRVSYVVTMSRKGTVLFERPYGTLEAAIAHLAWVSMVMFEGGTEGFDEDAWVNRVKMDETTCAQPGCNKSGTTHYRFCETYAKNGEGPLPSETLSYKTQFCDEHKERGNCGREDCDRNYELLKPL